MGLRRGPKEPLDFEKPAGRGAYTYVEGLVASSQYLMKLSEGLDKTLHSQSETSKRIDYVTNNECYITKLTKLSSKMKEGFQPIERKEPDKDNQSLKIPIKENIFIKDVDGTSKIVQLDIQKLGTTQLIEIIEKVTRVPKSQLRCTFQNKELNVLNQGTLENLGIRNNSTIEIKLRIAGGSSNLNIDEETIFLNYTENDHKFSFAQQYLKYAENEEFTLLFDGNSNPNPGISGAGIVIKNNEGTTIYSCSFSLGHATNNQAEYYGLIYGLRAAKDLKMKRIKVIGDSKLIIEQVKKVYQCKDAKLIPLNKMAISLSKNFQKISFEHHKREENTEADKFATEGIKGKPRLNYIQRTSSVPEKYQNMFNKLNQLEDYFKESNTHYPSLVNLKIEELEGQTIQQFLSLVEEHVDILCTESGTTDTIFDEDRQKARSASELLITEIFNLRKSNREFNHLSFPQFLKENPKPSRPVIMITNTKGVNLRKKGPYEEINYNLETGGSHWVAIVFLPQNFRGLLKNCPDDEFYHEFQKIIIFDSLPSSRMFPSTLKELMRAGFSHKYNGSDKDSYQPEHNYPNVFDNDMWIIEKCNRRQQNLNSCGYWAIFNALMTVLTGNHDFYDKFSIESSIELTLIQDQKNKKLINAEYYLTEILNSLIPKHQIPLPTTIIIKISKHPQTF